MTVKVFLCHHENSDEESLRGCLQRRAGTIPPTFMISASGRGRHQSSRRRAPPHHGVHEAGRPRQTHGAARVPAGRRGHGPRVARRKRWGAPCEVLRSFAATAS